MTESRWWRCQDPDNLLFELGTRISERKLRLVACGCCRLIEPLLPDERCQYAIDLMEHFADGTTTEANVRAAQRAGRFDARNAATQWAAEAVASLTRLDVRSLPHHLQEVTYHAARAARDAAGQSEWGQARSRQADVVRDLFRFPSHPFVIFDPSWLHWQHGLVVQMARTIYADYRFHELPILADALEEAGCENREVLDHCRTQPVHVRGCWVIDHLLGRE
jgi:hypothetical protein